MASYDNLTKGYKHLLSVKIQQPFKLLTLFFSF